MSHAFSHGYHPQHSERLAAYWAEALGGPPEYSESLGGESFVVRIHAGNGEHQEMDDRAQTCFAQALDDAGLPADPRLRATLKAKSLSENLKRAAFGRKSGRCKEPKGTVTQAEPKLR